MEATGKFFPYDARLVRCHPIAAAVTNAGPETDNLRVGSSRDRITILCAQCRGTISGTIFNVVHQTGHCTDCRRARWGTAPPPRYTGAVPAALTLPIRAGLLLGVDRAALLDLVVRLMPSDDAEKERWERAVAYVAELEGYDPGLLANNCFWGADSLTRSGGTRYKRPRTPRADASAPLGRLVSPESDDDNAGGGQVPPSPPESDGGGLATAEALLPLIEALPLGGILRIIRRSDGTYHHHQSENAAESV